LITDVPVVHVAHPARHGGPVGVVVVPGHPEDEADLHEGLSAEVDQGRMFIR